VLIGEFLDGLAARIATVDGLTATTNPFAEVVVPMVSVTDGDVTYHEAMVPGGLYRVEAIVTLYVSAADDPQGHYESRVFRSNCGPKSVARAIERSLGAMDILADVMSLKVDTSNPVNGGPFIAAVFDVSAHIPGESD